MRLLLIALSALSISHTPGSDPFKPFVPSQPTPRERAYIRAVLSTCRDLLQKEIAKSKASGPVAFVIDPGNGQAAYQVTEEEYLEHATVGCAVQYLAIHPEPTEGI